MTIASRRRGSAASFRQMAALAVLGLGGWATASCGAQSAPAPVPPKVVPTMSRAVAAQSPIDRYVAVAKQVYDTETGGAPVRRELSHVANDPRVVALLRSGSDAQMRRYVTKKFKTQWFLNEHVSRLRILRAGHAPLDLGVAWVVWPMLQRILTNAGHPRPTIQVSVQDVIGFVRAMHNKHPAVQVVVRDADAAHAVSLLGVAARAPLPATGFVTLRGVRYAVRSFRRWSFVQRPIPVTVWVLLPVGAR